MIFSARANMPCSASVDGLVTLWSRVQLESFRANLMPGGQASANEAHPARPARISKTRYLHHASLGFDSQGDCISEAKLPNGLEAMICFPTVMQLERKLGDVTGSLTSLTESAIVNVQPSFS